MHKEISGVILASGRGMRMGGEDKGLVPIGGIALYQYVLARLRPQVSSIAISANRNRASYQASGLPVIGDLTPDFSGLLAGLKQPTSQWVAFVPCDVPYFPTTLIEQFRLQKSTSLATYGSDVECDHPTLALLHTSLAPKLANYLAPGKRKLMLFLKSGGAQQVIFK